jgi:PHS family inorganic phosphate transporter-like MFS transporter
VLQKIFKNSGEVPLVGPTIKDNLCYQLLILALIGLPGYYVSVCFMDKLGRKNIQLQGFFFMAVLYGVLAIWLDELDSGLLITIYGLTYFFSNFGPNCTTFILPSETFPQEVRSTLNGFSAACGKAGAVVGSAAFAPIADAYGTGAAMGSCAICAVVGFILTFFFVEDRRGKGMAGNSIIVTNEALTSTLTKQSRLVAEDA